MSETSEALMLRPECPVPAHGRMELRPLQRQSPEQRWFGVWYDCTEPHCQCSVLYESAELRAQLAEMGDPRYARATPTAAHGRAASPRSGS